MIQNAQIKGDRGTRASTSGYARRSGPTDHQHASIAESILRATSIMSNLAAASEGIGHSASLATESMVKLARLMETHYQVSAVDTAVEVR